jgi:FixJ family two-component response regulator
MTQEQSPRLLIADDQPDVLEALRLLLKGEGFAIETVASPGAVLAALETREFAAALIDLNYARDTTSGQEGLDLLGRIQEVDSSLPVIVMTAWGSIELAVLAMRRGARDFIQKPWENARLVSVVKTQIELGRALRRGHRLEAEMKLLREEGKVNLIAESAAMQPVLQMIARVGPSEEKAKKDSPGNWRRKSPVPAHLSGLRMENTYCSQEGRTRSTVGGWRHSRAVRRSEPAPSPQSASINSRSYLPFPSLSAGSPCPRFGGPRRTRLSFPQLRGTVPIFGNCPFHRKPGR